MTPSKALRVGSPPGIPCKGDGPVPTVAEDRHRPAASLKTRPGDRPLTPGIADRDRQPLDATVARCPTRAPVQCVLPASLNAPSLAREFLCRWACPDHLTDPGNALLLVSELVTNALIHGRPPIGLALACSGTRTTVRVTDSDQQPILPQHPAAVDALSGRGLRLLQVLATDWGVHTGPHGKTFWFAL